MNIVHCFRSPVGGLFRHVIDLAEAQVAAGHQVGIICDSSTGGPFEEAILDRVRPSLSLGLVRMPMRRGIGPSDLLAAWRVRNEVRELDPDVLHGHGAKGGAYARLIGTLLRATGTSVARIYTPHGGSLHYEKASAAGRLYFLIEKLLARLTDAFALVSRYEIKTFQDKVGDAGRPVVLVPNGLRPREFDPVDATEDAADFLYIGHLRDLKGPDVFIDALTQFDNKPGSRSIRAVIVGAGEDKEKYVAQVAAAGLNAQVSFQDPMPARDAFALAHTVVVPSRAESMPYIVLEAIAAGKAIIATNVGGIPEIFGDLSDRLIPPGDVASLKKAMAADLADHDASVSATATIRDMLREQATVARMAEAATEAYRASTSR